MGKLSSDKVRFNNAIQREFCEELTMQVEAYFKDNGIMRFANRKMKLKGAIMFVLLIAPYFILIFVPMQFIYMELLAMVSGIGMVGVGYNIAHDACHSSYSRHQRINRLLGYTFNLVGISAYLWKIKHNLSHHTYTNIYFKDEDLLESDGVRLSPDQPYKPIHRFQHIYYFLFYPLYSLIWIFIYDWQVLMRFNGNGSPNANKRHPRKEVLIFLVTKIFYILVGVVIPIYLIEAPVWQVLCCFFTLHAVAGVSMACVVKLGHIVDNVEHFAPDENGVINNSWMVHEVLTTSNFSINNRFISWFTGGLNFQIEHHLFPRVCSVHYPKIAPIVQSVIKKYDLPYHVNKNIITGLASHYRALKKYGSPASIKAVVS